MAKAITLALPALLAALSLGAPWAEEAPAADTAGLPPSLASVATPLSQAESRAHTQGVVNVEGAIVYERPDLLANALRLLYAGEIVEILGGFNDPSGSRWFLIRMGTVDGFVKASAIQGAEGAKPGAWSPPLLHRDLHPLSFSLRAGAEMFGGGLTIHYMPFSRLGATFSVGSIFDYPEMKGTSLAFGAVSYLALTNFSPFVESGFTRLSYHQDYATLRIYSFFLSVGLEWMFRSGVIVNVLVTYMRSADVEISFDYLNARAGHTEVPPDFGVLDPGRDNTFQFVLPGVSLGYAF